MLASLSLSEDHDDVLQTYNKSAFAGFSARLSPYLLDVSANTTGIAYVQPIISIKITTMDNWRIYATHSTELAMVSSKIIQL